MKVVVLHPPLYPVNYDFYNHLGSLVDLIVLQFGEYPSDHVDWTAESLTYKRKSFELVVIGNGSDSFRNQLNFSFLTHIRKFKPDIVLSIAFWIPSILIALLKRTLKCKFIILTNAILATEKDTSYLRKLLRQITLQKTDCVISASQLSTDFLNSINKNLNIRLSKQTIDVFQWTKDINSIPDKKQLRKTLKLPENKIVFLGVGNFSYKKNWMSAISLLEKRNDSILVLIGDGAEKDKYIAYIKENNLGDKVILVPVKEGLGLKAYYKAADVFILPSLYEQYGFVVVEALICRLPVLCSKNVGASCLIEDGYNGYLIDPLKGFGEAANDIIKNYKMISSNCYLSVKDMTLENRAQEFHEIFKSIFS
ncbi:glycosyltransferase family 4 protein [Flavobacterium sp. XN-5]|uniref:glycosyltransferase family 4 protein n=1 Tax=Flavobacterium sp. XN-5 TaxID=2599390 RepID=UPI0011CB99D5|nr:glycosyltransferase family 4 protein [Flavobacterium sp. XN-5]NGY37404.1 glycosyltransferase family 4 protein [Flavobacterium sp. XN-5]